MPATDPILLTAVRIATLAQQQPLSNASGFFFQREDRLFLITSRHVVCDEASSHFPDRVEIELHVSAGNLAESSSVSLPLYRRRKALWRQGKDAAGLVDVAALEVRRSSLPAGALFAAFTPRNLYAPDDHVEVGAPLLIVGFPLGFHDSLHHLPVARQAALASSFGLRFQGHGYFLTDARTHRGTSGAPVVLRLHGAARDDGDLPWLLLGVHSSRFDMGPRDLTVDEALGLNGAWYADILLTLTENG